MSRRWHLWLLPLTGFLSGCDSRTPRSSLNPPSPSNPAKPPLAAVSPANPTRDQPWFVEVAAEAGIHFQHSSGFNGRHCMPEINTGGVGLIDFDHDGRLDIYCVNGGSVHAEAQPQRGHRLYRNLGAWHFQDVTEHAGVGINRYYGMGVACADFDGDGWTDIYLLNLGPNQLFRNRGDGTFEDVTERAGVGGSEWSSSAAFFDYDRDGRLDLFVVNYIQWSLATEVPCSSRGGTPDYCSPMSYRAPSRSSLYRNLGDGRFRDVSVESGVAHSVGNGLGVATGDFDQNGYVDVFVANDAMPNHLWMNQGNGHFRDEALARGCAVNVMGLPRAGMGVVAVDLLQRGTLDLFVTHLVGEGNGYFRNTDGQFSDTITPRGPGAPSWPSTGFGLGFRDFDHDGHPDLFVANGRARLGTTDLDPRDPYAEPNSLLRGLGQGEFAEVQPKGGTSPELVATSRGAAFGDLDDDGAEDIVILNKDGPLHVLRNQVGTGGHWIGFELRLQSPQLPHNAIVSIVESSGRRQSRQYQPHEGYASSQDPRIVFGIGSDTTVQDVIIRFPDRAEARFGPLSADRYHQLQCEGPRARP